MTDELDVVEADPVRLSGLNNALAASLTPPATPADLRAGVLAAIAREPSQDWEAGRRELQRMRRAAITELNWRYLRRCRDAILLGAGILAVLGFGIKPLSVWLTPFLANAAPMVAGCIALCIGVLCGTVIFQDLFHSPRDRP
jgi:hypothetical protein